MKTSTWILLIVIGVTIGAPCVHAEQVLFSEVMYHPNGTLPEYIEVCNNTATPMDIAEWRLSTGVEYVFPPFSTEDPGRTFLNPFERIVVCGVDETLLREAYAMPPTVRVYGPWTGSLDNGGERITLQDRNGTVVCTVEYNDRDPWPAAADGAGHTLVLRDPDKQVDDWRNWTASSRPGGTPGTEEVSEAETPVASPEVDLGAGMTFVDYGDTWRYHDQGLDMGTAWRELAFDDTEWPQGPGLLGFETATLPGPGIRTPLADLDQLTFYFRTRFTYNGPVAGVTIRIDQILDDGAVYYLNGQEIGRSGLAPGAVGFTTAANRTVGDATEELDAIVASGSALVNGINVLAVEVHQLNTTSSDVVFGARLRISVPVGQASLVINEVLPGPVGSGLVEIYNPGTEPVNLRDHYLSNDPAQVQGFRITEDILVPPGGLAWVGFSESGLALSDPLSVVLMAPDGRTLLQAIRASVPWDGRSIGRKPLGGDSWFLFTEPTPGAENRSQADLAARLHLNEVHFASSNKVDWVEFYNSGDEAASLEGLFLSSRADLSDRVALHGTVPARGFASQACGFPVSGARVSLFLTQASDAVLCARVFTRPAMGDCLQAFPQGTNEWYASAASTRDVANDPARNTDVVINEILYDPPSNEPCGEFIELHNRGEVPVDLSGWRFTDGIDFTFAPGTTIPAHGYLVVAADAEWMRSVYGPIPVVGDFDGKLSNQGERIRLVDSWGNLADEVDYLPGGSWPQLAHGDGSSMELMHPWMDNGVASAWVDSDESNKTAFQPYRISDVYRQLRTDGSPTDYKELHLHLVGDSHVALRSIALRQNGTGSNLILKGDRMSTTGRSDNGWLAQGTHYASFLEGGELHLVADGHGDNRANRVEIDATGLQANQTYEVSFEARWFSGASRLIVQTWDHSIAGSLSLPVPQDLGTPGAPNSCLLDSPAPQLDGLSHWPAVPAPGQAVQVTVQVRSVVASPQVLLFHRLDNQDGNGKWFSRPMADDGVTDGDALAGDGIYTATLTEYTTRTQVVQFYVAAIADGQITQLPREGGDRPALLVVDTPPAPGDLRHMRFVISDLDIRAVTIGNSNSSTPYYGYAFPRLSNHYFNMTMIVNEQDVTYGCEIRPSGSPWLRTGNVSRGKFKLPGDRLFRGKEKLTYDNDPTEGRMHHNRLTRYWLYLLGHPVSENEFVQVRVNAGTAWLREEVEPVGNDLLDRVYEDGSQGELYRFDDEWWFTDGWSRTYIPADWCLKPRDYQRPYLAPANTSYVTTDNPGRYRSEWMRRTRENEDDYSALIGFFKTVTSDTYTQTEIERLIDPVATMKMFAVRGYIYDWDFFSMQRGKNGYFYRRPTDGRFMFFHWDSDLAFQSANGYFYRATGERNDMTAVRPYIDKGYNLRLFKHYLAVLTEDYARNSARVNAWLQAEEDASSQYTVSNAYRNWFQSRETPANNFLGANRSMALAITTHGGNTVNTAANTMALSGTAPLRVFRVEAAGHPEAAFTWTSETAWTLSGIVLASGANALMVRGVNEEGVVLHQDTIVVNKTGSAPPVMGLTAVPASWQVSVSDLLVLSALDSFDPDGSPLTLAWSVTPSDADLDSSLGHVATARFSRPGLYTFSVTGQDAGGGSATIQREAAVAAPEGLSTFEGLDLESFWTLENLDLRQNYCTGPYYSLAEVPGHLVLHVWDTQAYPLAGATAAYPLVSRPLPTLTDWAFLAQVSLRGQVFGDLFTGVLVRVLEGPSPVRYALGIEEGSRLAVWRITAAGAASRLQDMAWDDSQAELRIRRGSDRLWFEQRTDEVWETVHTVDAARSVALRAGLFVATDTPQTVKVAFDSATLVDPAAAPGL